MNKTENTLKNMSDMTKFLNTAIGALELKTVTNISFTAYGNVSVMVDPDEIKHREGCRVLGYQGNAIYTYHFNGIEFTGVEVSQ